MATYVLVHGGWCYAEVARILRTEAHDRLTPHPWACFEQKLRLTNEDALWAIPQAHIVCTSTVATRDPDLMDRARSAGRLWEIDTGHDLMITEPQLVADALLELASA